MANDVNKQIYGSFVPVLKDEKLSVRILVSGLSINSRCFSNFFKENDRYSL